MTIYQGKCSWFGGPKDDGVDRDEDLALFNREDIEHFPDLFLKAQPPHTTGLARRLNPDTLYCAMRWDYKKTSREWLRTHKIQVTNNKGESVFVWPVDWGPNVDTGRIIDLSPQAMKFLDIKTDDVVTVIVNA